MVSWPGEDFFVDAIVGDVAHLSGADVRHLTRVLRAEPGQRYEITDNECAYLAEIIESRGERVQFRVLEPLPSKPPPVRITLYPALIKFDRFEWINDFKRLVLRSGLRNCPVIVIDWSLIQP
jgi:16S rRNA (uracil1498-N3)-methyltransferase